MHRESSIKNLIYAYIGQFSGVIINFIARIIFINCLNKEYLGINSLFTSIITFLSFAELGIGSAMTFSLYEPLAKDDKETIKSLMTLYKKYYRIIGCVILVLGFSLTPFLQYLIKEMPNIEGLRIYYMLFVINSAVSYFYTYKRSLIICDQKRYIATFYRYLFYFLLNVAQIVLLLLTKNYLLYLICQVIFTLLENIAVSRKAEKLYPYIKDKNIQKLKDKDSHKLNRDVKATFLARLGATIIKSTDSVVISKFLGVVEVGIYSNYMLITSALLTIINQVFTSITASIGNIGVIKEAKDLKKLFDKVFFLDFIVYGIVCTCLINVINPFITLWLGEEYLLDKNIMITIVISFFITGMRVSMITFKDAMGLYWRDKYRPVITCAVNVIFSIVLVNKIGLVGVIIGTIISSIFIDLAIEPYYIYKYTLEAPVKEYYINYIKYFSIVVCTSIIAMLICNIINVSNLILEFILKGFISAVISIFIIIVLFYQTDNFKYLLDSAKVAIHMMTKKVKER